MAELLDSGARRDFGTGAVRDVAEGKGRCDLIPLKVISEIGTDPILADIDNYIRHGDKKYLQSAVKAFSAAIFGNIYTAMLEVSKQYEDGAKKYADRNWEKGIPLHCFIDSGVRHYLKFMRGDTDEPHDRAFVWNMLGAIWTHENKPELIDLPFADMGKPEPVSAETVEPWGTKDNSRLMRMCACRCEKCPLKMSSETSVAGIPCCKFCEQFPAKARAIMDEWEAEHNG